MPILVCAIFTFDVRIMELLLENGANVDYMIGDCGILHYAMESIVWLVHNPECTLAMIERLLSAGISLSARDKEGQTALMVACSWGPRILGLVSLLANSMSKEELDMTILRCDGTEKTAFDLALTRGSNIIAVEILLTGMVCPFRQDLSDINDEALKPFIAGVKAQWMTSIFIYHLFDSETDACKDSALGLLANDIKTVLLKPLVVLLHLHKCQSFGAKGVLPY